MYCVYKHTTPDGKIYIGITNQKPEDRWRNGRGYRTQIFGRAVKKYGWENIKHEILFFGLEKKTAEEKEIELIEKYKSNDKRFGYNIENGGNVKGTHSEETKRKIGIAHKGKVVSEESRQKMRMNHADVRREKNPMFGKHPSEETRKKLSAAHKGKQTGDLNPMYGRHHSAEVRMMQSIRRKGKYTGSANHKSRSIVQFALDGTHIKTYECILDAARELNLSRGCDAHISACANGKLRTAYGYIWKYAENEVRG